MASETPNQPLQMDPSPTYQLPKGSLPPPYTPSTDPPLYRYNNHFEDIDLEYGRPRARSSSPHLSRALPSYNQISRIPDTTSDIQRSPQGKRMCRANVVCSICCLLLFAGVLLLFVLLFTLQTGSTSTSTTNSTDYTSS